MEILVVHEAVDEETLRALANTWHQTFVKGVADVRRGLIALGGEWHVDAQKSLLKEGSEPKDIWGFSIYPNKKGDAAIEYESLINIRPKEGNRDREISSKETRRAVRKVAALAIPFLGL